LVVVAAQRRAPAVDDDALKLCHCLSAPFDLGGAGRDGFSWPRRGLRAGGLPLGRGALHRDRGDGYRFDGLWVGVGEVRGGGLVYQLGLIGLAGCVGGVAVLGLAGRLVAGGVRGVLLFAAALGCFVGLAAVPLAAAFVGGGE